MNKFPPRASRFTRRSLVVAPSEARLPFRLWMTGSLAVVVAALIPMRDNLADGSRSGQLRLLRHSRFRITETLQRIEATAGCQGLQVLARLAGARPVIVLASSVGGTPAVMDEPNSSPAIPLGLLFQDDGLGGADVLGIGSAPADRRVWRDFPDAVVRDVAGLPQLIEQALG